MEKQTSIDWFIDKLPIRMKNYLREEIETARKMHKEEIEDAWYADDEYGDFHFFEDYYQKTFGNKQ